MSEITRRLAKSVLDSRITLFCCFVVLILIKCIIFHRLCIGIIPHNPLSAGFATILAFWLPKIAVAMIVAIPLMFTKRTWWSIIWMLIIDIWIIANLIYFRANPLFLSLDAIRMAGNLNGFSSSILIYLDMKVWIYIIITLVYALCWWFTRRSIKAVKQGFITLGLAVVCSLIGGVSNFFSFKKSKAECEHYDLHFDMSWLNPFVTPQAIAIEDWMIERQQFNYIMNHSIVSYSINMFVEGIKLDNRRLNPQPRSEEEKVFVDNLPDITAPQNITPNKNLILIVVESLESWTLEMTDINGNQVTPKMNRFLSTHPHLYAPRISSQVKFGVSGDGQMMLNTGLMPISSGAACLLYSNNTYPNFAHFFDNSAFINPVKNTWNKTEAARNYGYKNLVEPDDNHRSDTQTTHNNFWWDDQIFEVSKKQCAIMAQDSIPYCTMILTLSTHQPFNLYDSDYIMPFDNKMPKPVQDYLGAVHYADEYLGGYLEWLDENGQLDNSVVVITGDHTVFRNIDFQELQNWAKSTQLSIGKESNYCPLIILSPDINQTRTIDDVCYQMDIFPTMLDAVGLSEYHWKGFGVSLLNNNSPSRTKGDLDRAYSISDLIIRSNAFAK